MPRIATIERRRCIHGETHRHRAIEQTRHQPCEQQLLGNDAPPERLYVETEWPRLDEGGTGKLGGWLIGHPDARVVLIDVWPRIRPRSTKRSADQYTVDYDAAAMLQVLATVHGIAVVRPVQHAQG
jgi:hypothetical protein